MFTEREGGRERERERERDRELEARVATAGTERRPSGKRWETTLSVS